MYFKKYTLQHKIRLSDKLYIFPNFNLKRVAITAIMQFYELHSIREFNTWFISGSGARCPWYRACLLNTGDFCFTKESRPEKEKANEANGCGVKDNLSECASFRNKGLEFISDIYFTRSNGCSGIFSLAQQEVYFCNCAMY